MRVGVVILPDQRWQESARRWRAAEEMGLATAWTYDHLAWRGLADGPWFATVPTLAAAAVTTSRIRLGTFVASPNYRHPVPFAKELMSLDDLSRGRFVLGVGAGGTGVDATVLGGDVLPPHERVERLAEFVDLLDRLLTHDRTSYAGARWTAVDARMLPGCLAEPRLPFVVAANGPRSMQVVARHGQGWVTTGATPPEEGEEAWWAGVRRLVARLDDVLAAEGRDPASVERYLNVDSAPTYSLTSLERARDVLGRAEQLGFDEVAVHWPRESRTYAGDEEVLAALAAELPRP